jgi:hypothetical protein
MTIRPGIGDLGQAAGCGADPTTWLDDIWAPSPAACAYWACMGSPTAPPMFYWSCPQSGSIGTQTLSGLWPILAAGAGILLLIGYVEH